MMLSRIPSVKDTYFQHKVLSKIHGKPTYESLQKIWNIIIEDENHHFRSALVITHNITLTANWNPEFPNK
jgi:hypothetical protein